MDDVYPVHVDNPVIPSPATGTAVAGKEKDVAGQMDRMLDQFEWWTEACANQKASEGVTPRVHVGSPKDAMP